MNEQTKSTNCTSCPPFIIWALSALAVINVGILIAIFWKL